MATFTGNGTGSDMYGYMHARVYVTRTDNSNGTTCSVKVECYAVSDGGSSDFISGRVSNNEACTTWSSYSSEKSVSANATVSMTSATFTVNRTTSQKTITCRAQIAGGGTGMYNGTSDTASVNVTIPALASYTISYNGNKPSAASGTVANIPENQTKYHGTNLTLSTTKPTLSGYIFKGWATSATSTTVAYSSGATYTGNAALTLYAIWQQEEEIEFKTLSSLADGTGLGIGKKATTSNLLDINFNTQINKNFSQRNATNIQLDDETKKAWRAALAPKILFSGDSNGTITLSESAANYDHMRIYYRVYNDANGYRSVKIFKPNGKNVNLFAGETGQDNGYFWPAGRDITISGTSITTRATNRYYAASSVGASSRTTAKTNYVYITCVEVW